MVNCGLKYNQLKCFLKRGARVDVVPWDYDLSKATFDGLFISNGPGDPNMCEITIQNIRKALSKPKKFPVFGICLGHQLLSLAVGCKSYKMRYIAFFQTENLTQLQLSTSL